MYRFILLKRIYGDSLLLTLIDRKANRYMHTYVFYSSLDLMTPKEALTTERNLIIPRTVHVSINSKA